MRAFLLALLLVSSAWCAPQGARDSEEPQQKRARQYVAPVVLGPQFGARIAAPAFPSQRLGYYPGAPQAFYPQVQPVAHLRKSVYNPARPVVDVPAPGLQVSVPKAAPAPVQYPSEPFHVIVKQVQDDNFDGSFTSSYETDHGIVVESSGYLKNAGTPDEVQVIQGSYSYISSEGVPITTYYIADENGFQVQGDHLPVPPALSQPIAKALEYQRSLPPSIEDLQEAAKNA